MKAVNLWVVCPNCDGSGYVEHDEPSGRSRVCPSCNGTGQAYDPKVLDYLDSWMMGESVAVTFLEGLVEAAALREEE